MVQTVWRTGPSDPQRNVFGLKVKCVCVCVCVCVRVCVRVCVVRRRVIKLRLQTKICGKGAKTDAT